MDLVVVATVERELVRIHVILYVVHAPVVLEIVQIHVIHFAHVHVQDIVAKTVKALVLQRVVLHVLVNANMVVKPHAWVVVLDVAQRADLDALHVWRHVKLHAITIAVYCVNQNALVVNQRVNLLVAAVVIQPVDLIANLIALARVREHLQAVLVG